MKLKPCPFCGASNVSAEDFEEFELGTFWIRCKCGASSGIKDTLAEATKAWNTRADPDEVEFSPEWLMSERQRHGLSKNELGRRIGVSSTSIRKWENGECRPKELILRKLKEELEGDAD